MLFLLKELLCFLIISIINSLFFKFLPSFNNLHQKTIDSKFFFNSLGEIYDLLSSSELMASSELELVSLFIISSNPKFN